MYTSHMHTLSCMCSLTHVHTHTHTHTRMYTHTHTCIYTHTHTHTHTHTQQGQKHPVKFPHSKLGQVGRDRTADGGRVWGNCVLSSQDRQVTELPFSLLLVCVPNKFFLFSFFFCDVFMTQCIQYVKGWCVMQGKK